MEVKNILNALRCALGINSGRIIYDFNTPERLRTLRGAIFHREKMQRKVPAVFLYDAFFSQSTLEGYSFIGWYGIIGLVQQIGIY